MASNMTSSEKKMGTNSSATQRIMQIGSDVAVGPLLPSTTLEAPRMLSLANRRLYRQHRTYRCKVNLLSGTLPVTDVPVYALANNWYVRKALALAKHMFDTALEQEQETVGHSRWNDFRIKPGLLSTGMTATAPTAFPIVLDADGSTQTALQYGTSGEYNYSEVQVGVVGRSFEIGRPTDNTRYNVFEEFNQMGPNPPQDPEGAITGGYDNIDPSFIEEQVQELLNKGNLPPYEADLNARTPQVWVEVGRLGNDSQGSMRLTTGFFDAPLGLIWMPTLNMLTTDVTPTFELECAAGDYKGVMSLDI